MDYAFPPFSQKRLSKSQKKKKKKKKKKKTPSIIICKQNAFCIFHPFCTVSRHMTQTHPLFIIEVCGYNGVLVSHFA
jgi:hypothetical protein